MTLSLFLTSKLPCQILLFGQDGIVLNTEFSATAQRFALPAAGENKARKRVTAKVQNQLQKTRRVPAVRCTLCWLAFWFAILMNFRLGLRLHARNS
jgi:hypothetical protein